jgi:hypothetical protein
LFSIGKKSGGDKKLPVSKIGKKKIVHPEDIHHEVVSVNAKRKCKGKNQYKLTWKNAKRQRYT